jgi:signal transduction histidine kinase
VRAGNPDVPLRKGYSYTMTATSFESAPIGAPAHDAQLVALFDEMVGRAGVKVQVLVYAEYMAGHLFPHAVGDVDSDQAYLMARLAEGMLDRLADEPVAIHLPHSVPGLERRSLVAASVHADGTLVGVVVAVSDRLLEIADLRSLEAQTPSVAADLTRHAEERRATHRRREGDLLVEITKALAASAQLPQLVPVIARNSARIVGFDRATVLLWQADGTMSAGASQFVTGQPDIRLWGAFRSLRKPLPAVRSALEQAEPAVFERPEEALELQPGRWIEPFGIRSVMVLPLLDRGRRLGAIILDSEHRQRVGPDRLRLARRVADQSAAAIAAARAVQLERSARQRAQLVLGTVVQAATQLNTTGVLTVIAEGINSVVDDTTTVAFVLENGKAARLALAGVGDGTIDVIETLTAPGTFPPAESPFDSRYGGPTQLAVNDDHFPELARLGIGRILVTPVRRAARELAWVVSYDARKDRYLEDDLRVVAGIAAQAALSLHTAALLEGERAAVARLEDLDRLKTAFVAAVSHELRTPLTAIVGFSEILSEEISAEGPIEYIENMRREAAVLEALIGNLLDTSRLEAGMLQLNLSTIDVNSVVSEAAAVVRHSHADRALELILPPDRVMIIGDSPRLRQVFVNLLENAAKYSPPGSPIELTVWPSVATPSGTMLEIAVDDRGPGIPVEHREAVFERFHRLASHSGKPGTGIGLYLVKALVEAHGGSIKVHDNPCGVGARFLVRLPVGNPSRVP